MKQQRISGKEAVRVAEDMAKPGPIRVVAASEAQEAPGALVPSPGSELDRKAPPRVRKPLPRNDQWKAPTPDLEGHRKRLREALGNTLSDEFVDRRCAAHLAPSSGPSATASASAARTGGACNRHRG